MVNSGQDNNLLICNMTIKDKFITAVLGQDGYGAFKKALERSPSLNSVLAPRTIVAWLNITSRFNDYEGELPGVKNSFISFKKTEDGLFSGDVALNDGVYSFNRSNFEHLAAVVASALGLVNETIPDDLRQVDIVRLGKTIDLLVKTKVITNELSQSNMNKLEPMGGMAKPAAPEAPAAPTGKAPSANMKMPKKTIKAPKRPAMAKPTLKLNEKEAVKKCEVCGDPQFSGGRFKGCLCFRDLSKSVETTKTNDGWEIKVGEDWDKDVITTFWEAVGRLDVK